MKQALEECHTKYRNIVRPSCTDNDQYDKYLAWKNETVVKFNQYCGYVIAARSYYRCKISEEKDWANLTKTDLLECFDGG